jgi:protein TonB
MFENAVLPSGHEGRRYWPVIMGFTGEFLLVACVLAAPLIWPQLLPRARMLAWIMAPAPPPVTKSPAPTRVRALKPFQSIGGKVYEPVSIPPQAVMIDDPPPESQAAGVEDGVRGLDAATTALGLLRPMGAPPRAVAAPVVAAPAVAAPSPTRQIRVVSALQMARLLHRVEPVYPTLARQTRISGTVELTGVIGADGRIRELRLVSGHPFLAAAALEAVRQWVYEPTLLNGEPVEVIAPITVNFRLN